MSYLSIDYVFDTEQTLKFGIYFSKILLLRSSGKEFM